MSGNPQHTTKSVEYYTPVPIVEAARAVAGGFDLDPASCELANRVVRANRYYSESSMHKSWIAPRIFLNPPGKSKLNPKGATPWWTRLAGLVRKQAVDVGIYIGFSNSILRTAPTDDGLHPLDYAVCIPKQRIAFDTVDADGNRVPTKSPSHDNIIVCVTRDLELIRRFRDAFAPFGKVTW